MNLEEKEFECIHCDDPIIGFENFRVHLWLKHKTTYGNIIYPEDLKKQGYEIRRCRD